jgi:hypothetical protein
MASGSADGGGVIPPSPPRGTKEAGAMMRLGTGIGWRPEIADAVERMPGVDWVETVAENVCPGHLPDSLL